MASSGEPMGEIIVGPVVSIPKTCAGRGAVKVTIASARATAPTCSPMTSASAPEGISTATTGAGTRIQRGDGFGVKPAHWRAEAGAEDGIDQNIRIKDRAGGFGLQLFVRRHCDRRDRQLGKHFGGIAAQLRSLRQQQYAHVFAGLMQLAGGDKSVSAVISLSANNAEAFGGRIVRDRRTPPLPCPRFP